MPLADAAREALDPACVLHTFESLTQDREAFAARLDAARNDELETIASRGAVLDRMLALAADGA